MEMLSIRPPASDSHYNMKIWKIPKFFRPLFVVGDIYIIPETAFVLLLTIYGEW